MSAVISNEYKSLLLALLTLMVACNTDRGNVVAWVNQHPISRSEFEHWMLLERAEVHNYFHDVLGIALLRVFLCFPSAYLSGEIYDL